jgi:adenylate cyclase
LTGRTRQRCLKGSTGITAIRPVGAKDLVEARGEPACRSGNRRRERELTFDTAGHTRRYDDVPVEALSTDGLATRAGVRLEDIERFAALGILSSSHEPFRVGDVTRVRLLQALEQSGISPGDVGRAISSGEFSFAALEMLFPPAGESGLSELTFREMSERTGLSMEFTQDIYAALALPAPQPDDRLRMDDVEMVPVLLAYMSMPFLPADLTYSARFWGENMYRLTQSEVRFFETHVMQPLLRQGLSEQQMLEIALPQGAMAQELDTRVLVWLHKRHVEQHLIEQVLDHVESAMERAGAIRRRAREVPAIGFLDLSGFTALTESQGDEAAVELSSSLTDLVRKASRERGGHPVKFLGDGVMCYYARPASGVQAALDMVEGAKEAGLPPARVGLNAGPVIARDSDYFGRTVNIASRVAAYAGPGQVLVTDDLCSAAGELPGVTFDPIGEVQLKGLARPVALRAARRRS